MIEGEKGVFVEGRPHDLEVARLQVSLDAVEADAREECKINHQLAQLIHMRLEAARKAAERLLGVLQVSRAHPLVPHVFAVPVFSSCLRQGCLSRAKQAMSIEARKELGP